MIKKKKKEKKGGLSCEPVDPEAFISWPIETNNYINETLVNGRVERKINEGYKKLWASVLCRAIADAFEATITEQSEQRSAKLWLSNTRSNEEGSFNYVCEALDLTESQRNQVISFIEKLKRKPIKEQRRKATEIIRCIRVTGNGV